MTLSGNGQSNSAWTTRLGEVLTEITGTQPAIRQIPPGESDVDDHMLWWRSSSAPETCIGVSETDAALLLQMRRQALPGDADPLRSNLSEILESSRGRGEIVSQSSGDPESWEVVQVDFASAGKVRFFVAQAGSAPPDNSNLDMLMDIELPITLRFGSTRMALRDIAGLNAGSVIEFDRKVDDPVEVMVNGHVVARGEAVMVQGSYGVRISEISSRREGLLTSSVAGIQGGAGRAGGQIG